MKQQSLSKNYIYQFFYQFLILILPLILASYLTRTLQEKALGTYTYINSIAYYFVIAANLGIGVYGKRTISRARGNHDVLRKTFWSLYLLHVVFSCIILVTYIIFIILFINNDKNIYIINVIYVASTIFDITWLFYGMENFSSVVIKNTLVKIIVCIGVVIFVKKPNDVWIYTLIVSLGTLLGHLCMMPQAIKYLKPTKISFLDMRPHIKPIFTFSVAIIASSLYTVFDKTLIGMITNKENVAFYEYANQIIMVPLTFVGIIGSVMFPRACKLVKDGNLYEQKKNINISLILTAFIGMGSIFGLLLIARDFSIIYYGEAFSVCGNIMIALSPLVYIIGAGSVIRSEILIPNGMDKKFNFSILYNAIINIIISILMIPKLGIYGAVIGTLMAEIFGFLYQINMAKDFIEKNVFLKTIGPSFVSGIIMYIFTKLIINPNSTYKLLLTVIIGVVIYCFMFLILMFIFERELLKRIIKKIKCKFFRHSIKNT